ncbi:hypothetical protein JDV02_004511 [Purpureocillium takamizusanense]|uniref:Uncharacterized protein n=1 Tax=Purpureocillium takamizusanense TaxID=2060973 RepID=A0A9Q8VAV8_9HYPO|nr:uncharacterized protein JDV02_004511 [Purpureocillium takamizusanense]UNI18231.1 hypothetical protein JDV02_004511 [Purpureocillium takamizusanense]
MADAASRQALASTFAFGMVVSAAVGAASLHCASGSSSLFRNGTRLVLIIFLICSSLWASTAFVATLIHPTAAAGCQAAVAVASAFDQLARIMLQEFLFWSMDNDVRASLGILFPQAVIVLRFILGGIFVGVQRPQFQPVCAGTTLVIALGVAVLAADAFIVLMLCIRASSAGIFRDVSEKTADRERSKALVVVTLSLAVWIAAGVPLTLGIPSLDLAVRVVLAAAGVLFVIAFVAFFGPSLTAKSVANTSRRPPISRPEYIPSRAMPNVGTRTQDISTQDEADRAFAGRPRAPITTQPARTTRSSRQVKDMSGLPTISRPNPGQAKAGVGGLPVTGELFPPMKAPEAPVTLSASQPRPLKKTGVKGGKPVISRPVLTAQSEEGPLKKMTMVDLATAARNERERRGQLDASQPVTPAKALSQDELRTQAQTFKRKEISPANALSANPPTPAAMTTSSAQLLSPMTDELRRRSPRQSRQTLLAVKAPAGVSSASARQDGADASISTATSPPALPPRSPLRLKTAQGVPGPSGPMEEAALPTDDVTKSISDQSPAIMRPMQDTVAIDDKRSKKPSSSSPRDSVELLVPQVPPLSPRVSQTATLETSDSQRRVHRPLAELSRNGSVRPNIRPSRQRPLSPPNAKGEPALPPKAPVQLRTTNGIPSNPRAGANKTPIREIDTAKDQTVMVANGAQDDVGGPTRGAMDRALSDILKRRPVADDTSPTSNAASIVHRPRPIPRSRYSPSSRGSARLNHSPMPLLSYSSPETATYPLSAGLLGSEKDQDIASQPSSEQPSSDDTRAQRRRSSSFPGVGGSKFKLFPASATGSIPPTPTNSTVKRPVVPPIPSSYSNDYKASEVRSRRSTFKAVSKFSIDTVVSPQEEQQSAPYGPLAGYRSSGEGTNRRSSMVLPSETQEFPTSPNSAHSGLEGSTANRTIAPTVSARHLESEAAVTLSNPPAWPGDGPQRTMDGLLPADDDDDDGHETVTFMLDRSAMPQNERNQGVGQGDRNTASWHRRVGDHCPTFSNRKSTSQTRIVTPPPPLLLGQPMRPRRHPAPDPVQLESPQEALDQIQQQLRMLEEIDGQSDTYDQQRLSLLANLEQEMGMQESRWQQMHNDLTRISLSTAISSPSTPGTNSRSLSLDVSPIVRVVESDSPALRTLGPGEAVEDGHLFSPEFAATAIANQVHITRPGFPPQAVPLAQPRPGLPDVDAKSPSVKDGTDSRPVSAHSQHSNVLNDENNEDGMVKNAVLEQYPGFVMCDSVSASDSTEVKTPKQPLGPGSPAPLVRTQTEPERPVTRRSFSESQSLEGSRGENISSGSVDGSALSPGFVLSPPGSLRRPQQKATRPRTMRPPRRPKRISTLPDIVENPQPLRGKRDTLGLFQFPWGERSDVATIPLTFSMRPGTAPAAAMPRTGPLYPTLESQIRTLESQRYPASFFEDYDEKDEGDGDSVDSSDDDFDEATLWEIASLLKSDNIPSRESLFPGQEEERLASASIVEDYLDGDAFLDEAASDVEPTTAPLVRETTSPTLPGSSKLWVDRRDSDPEAKTHRGLPQPNLTAWEGYMAAAGDGRVASRKTGLPSIDNEVGSTTQSNAANAASSSSSGLWTLQITTPPPTAVLEAIIPSQEQISSHSRDDGSSSVSFASKSLWSPPKPAINESGVRHTMPSSPTVSKSIGITVDAIHHSSEAVAQQEQDTIVSGSIQTRHEDAHFERLWSAPEPISPVERGLPHPESETWERYILPENSGRRTRSPEPLQSLESRALWASSDRNDSETLGQPQHHSAHEELPAMDVTDSVPPPMDSSKSDSTESQSSPSTDGDKALRSLSETNTGLWLPAPTKVTEEPRGMFQIGTPIVFNRDAAPAAQATRPNRRTEQQPLPPIQSSGLWASPLRHSFSHDWVSLSSVRPNTPGGTSSYSGSETPRSDGSSAHSSVTGMSTINSVFAVCPETGLGDAATSATSKPAQGKRKPPQRPRTSPTAAGSQRFPLSENSSRARNGKPRSKTPSRPARSMLPPSTPSAETPAARPRPRHGQLRSVTRSRRAPPSKPRRQPQRSHHLPDPCRQWRWRRRRRRPPGSTSRSTTPSSRSRSSTPVPGRSTPRRRATSPRR